MEAAELAALKGALGEASAEGLATATPLAGADRTGRIDLLLARIKATVMPRVLTLSCPGGPLIRVWVENGRIGAFAQGEAEPPTPVTPEDLTTLADQITRIIDAPGPATLTASAAQAALECPVAGFSVSQLGQALGQPQQPAAPEGNPLQDLVEMTKAPEEQTGADFLSDGEILITGASHEDGPLQVVARTEGQLALGQISAVDLPRAIKAWQRAV